MLFVISGDSDLIPAVELTRKHFGKTFTSILPPHGKGKEIQGICDFQKKIRPKTVQHCLLPDNYALKNGEVISIPKAYQEGD